MNPAQSSRLAKEKSPQDWCSNSRCLWNVRRSGPCPKHPVTENIASLWACKNCGETRTTFIFREETTCRHIESDAGNPHGNMVLTTHVWERRGTTNPLPHHQLPISREEMMDIDDADLAY